MSAVLFSLPSLTYEDGYRTGRAMAAHGCPYPIDADSTGAGRGILAGYEAWTAQHSPAGCQLAHTYTRTGTGWTAEHLRGYRVGVCEQETGRVNAEQEQQR